MKGKGKEKEMVNSRALVRGGGGGFGMKEVFTYGLLDKY